MASLTKFEYVHETRQSIVYRLADHMLTSEKEESHRRLGYVRDDVCVAFSKKDDVDEPRLALEFETIPWDCFSGFAVLTTMDKREAVQKAMKDAWLRRIDDEALCGDDRTRAHVYTALHTPGADVAVVLLAGPLDELTEAHEALMALAIDAGGIGLEVGEWDVFDILHHEANGPVHKALRSFNTTEGWVSFHGLEEAWQVRLQLVAGIVRQLREAAWSSSRQAGVHSSGSYV